MEWEYLVIDSKWGKADEDIMAALDGPGLTGWELVSVITCDGSVGVDIRYYFKREKPHA